MSLKSKFDEFDRELDSKINLGKKFPGYFNKWVFRFMVVGILFVVLLTCQSMNWDFSRHYYVYCPGPTKCENVFYQCTSLDCLVSGKQKLSCPVGFEADSLCTQQFIFPGGYVGVPPSWLGFNAWWIDLVLVVLAVVLNHLFYKVKSRW